MTPGRESSRCTHAWSISALLASDLSRGGYILERIAESSMSSGSGHSRPTFLAARSTSCTVDAAHPTEKATLRWLIPMAVSLRISLYLTMLSPFSGVGRPLHPSGKACI